MNKTFKIIGIIFVICLLLFAIIFFISKISSNKIICRSSLGNIMISYNNDELTGYTTTGKIYYDFDNQKAYAGKIGIESYLDQFNDWFVNNTNGKCSYKK